MVCNRLVGASNEGSMGQGFVDELKPLHHFQQLGQFEGFAFHQWAELMNDEYLLKQPTFYKKRRINTFQTNTERLTQGTVYCKPIMVLENLRAQLNDASNVSLEQQIFK